MQKVNIFIPFCACNYYVTDNTKLKGIKIIVRQDRGILYMSKFKLKLRYNLKMGLDDIFYMKLIDIY